MTDLLFSTKLLITINFRFCCHQELKSDFLQFLCKYRYMDQPHNILLKRFVGAILVQTWSTSITTVSELILFACGNKLSKYYDGILRQTPPLHTGVANTAQVVCR